MIKRYFQVSLYVLIPLIAGGITFLMLTIMFFDVSHHVGFKETVDYSVQILVWEIIIATINAAISFLFTWMLLRPVTKFIKKAERLPVFPKPSVEDEMKPRDALEHFSQIFDQLTSILSKVEAKELFPGIIGQSKIMRGIFAQILKVAPTDSTVLILGESGTGKELVAMSLYEHSRRRGGPFIKINCVAIPENLLESELFGHEKGAFTGATAQKIGRFEMADGGTIFLDEIGDMPLATQAKLLRVLQEKEFERVGGNRTIRVNVRFLVATNKNLSEMVKQGLFREDLYYRINVFSIWLPPLRERREDIPYLVDYFLEKNEKSIKISPLALQVITAYPWPGNVRELQNVIERAAVLSETDVIERAHLPVELSGGFLDGATRGEESSDEHQGGIDDRINQIEKAMIIEALNRTGGIQVRAAELLGINQRSLWHRIKKHGIDAESLKSLQKM
jgi:transcriptional regulator with GAF, ATPase, and Fis domain